MPNSLSSNATLVDFAVALATASRLFVASQLARHPDLSWRSQPIRRAKEVLRAHPDIFERMNGPMGEQSRYRLTREARRLYGVTEKPVASMTARAYHWLGLGDIWLEMAFHGGRPSEWRTEVDHHFDAMCQWQGQLLLIEYQRTPITSAAWRKKWETRRAWYRQQKWDQSPTILLVNQTGQQDSTICLPRGTIHVRDLSQIRRALSLPLV